MKKYQIFISSTYIDLIDERQAAVEAILQSGHIPAGMELFAASNQSQWEIIKKWIDESDIYMLILGGRYGSIEQTSGLSYTELEYNYALETNKPLFALILNEDFIELNSKTQGSKTILELNEPQKLKAFSAKVLSKLCKICIDSKDIQLGVFQSISSLERDNELTGWIKANQGLNPKPYLDQITALQHEKDALNKEIVKLKKSTSKTQDIHDFDDILRIFEKENVSLKRLQEDGVEIPDEIGLLRAFDIFKENLIVGATNSATSGTQDTFIFYDLAPKLQIHGLMRLEKTTNSSAVRRYIITDKGLGLLAYMAKNTR